MEKEIELVLDPEMLSALRSIWKDEISGLSPFLMGDDMDEEKGAMLLAKAGILEDGEVKQDLLPALDITSRASKGASSISLARTPILAPTSEGVGNK